MRGSSSRGRGGRSGIVKGEGGYLSHLLSGKIHKKCHSQDDDEVEDHQLVHFLPNLGLPALKPKTGRDNETRLRAEKARFSDSAQCPSSSQTLLPLEAVS